MKLRTGFLLPTLLLAATSLHAASLAPACTANTMQYYEGINSDSVCSVGILNFESFSFNATGTGGAVPLTAAQIELTPCNGEVSTACLTDPTSMNGGFSISAINPAAFSLGAGQTETYTVDWLFVIDNGPADDGASLGLDPPFGDVSVTQTYCLDSYLNPACYTDYPAGFVPPQTISVDNNHPPGSLTNSVTFGTPAYYFADVQTVITLTGGTSGAGFDAVTGTADIVDLTPEPAAFMLAAGGILALGALRRWSARG